MTKISVYCCTIENCKVLEKLPSYITPVGLGNKKFPKNWEIEKNGENISKLNKYYAELTMYYWMWKNKFKKYEENDFIGTCKHDLLWLNMLYTKKQNSVLSTIR